MRDLLIVLIVFGSLPFILRKPFIGVLVWSWLGYMNPHRLTWGFAYDFPFAQVVALTTLAGLFLSSDSKRWVWNGTTVVWVLLIAWMNVTTLFALNPELAQVEWDRVMKIQLVTFVTLLVMHGRFRIEALVWVIALSLGFFGIKGGLFAIRTGGNYMVWGPPGSFIEGNNSIGLALVMIMPLLWYLQLNTSRKLLRWALLGAIALCSLAVLSTQSRGAFLAIVAMMGFLWLKSPKKLVTGTLLLMLAPVAFLNMPQKWHDRMATIRTYEQDDSAMGRINAWWFAFNIAKERPLIGGGFNVFTEELFQYYAPDPEEHHDAHSIYFEMLGEHGFVGLTLFLWLGMLALASAQRIIRRARDGPELQWAGNLAAMIQVSLVGYAVGGAFLGLAYFDLLYHLVALIVLLEVYVRDVSAAETSVTESRDRSASPEPAMRSSRASIRRADVRR